MQLLFLLEEKGLYLNTKNAAAGDEDAVVVGKVGLLRIFFKVWRKNTAVDIMKVCVGCCVQTNK